MFNEEQLNRIKEAAKKVRNQGELAVYRKLFSAHAYETFTPSQWNVIAYCAEECKRQRSGEMSVYDMVCAWNMAQRIHSFGNQITVDIVENIGKVVEPDDNKYGFRTIPIGVTDGLGGWIEKAPHHRIEFLLSTLISSYYTGWLECLDCDKYIDLHRDGIAHFDNPLSKTPEDQFYYEYEEIHPFRDGNGRSGKILYNYLLDTLDDPQMPPNYWNSSNP